MNGPLDIKNLKLQVNSIVTNVVENFETKLFGKVIKISALVPKLKIRLESKLDGKEIQQPPINQLLKVKKQRQNLIKIVVLLQIKR
jgi:hypothetical protein